MKTFRTLARFINFILQEYVRSGRIVVELIATLAFCFIFLRPSGEGMEAHYFFTVTGIFSLGLTLYTVSSSLNLGDRPQGYVLLARRLDSTSYLLGYYLNALLIVTGMYLLICITTVFWNPPSGLSSGGWLLGTLPLLLNVGLLGALLLMLSPLVFSAGWRLFVLTLIALAFSSNFIPRPILDALPAVIQRLLTSLQTVLSWPLVPAFRGFALSLSRDYSGSASIIIIAQISLLIALLGLAMYAFAQRDLVFSG